MLFIYVLLQMIIYLSILSNKSSDEIQRFDYLIHSIVTHYAAAIMDNKWPIWQHVVKEKQKGRL